MNIAPIKAVLPKLEGLLQEAQSAFNSVQREHDIPVESDGSNWDEPEAALRHYLLQIYGTLSLALEAADLKEKASEVHSIPRGSLGKTNHYPDHMALECRTLQFAVNLIADLSSIAGQDLSTLDEFEILLLEKMLARTAHLVRSKGKVPMREPDIQAIMDEYLAAYFIDYKTNFSILKPTTSVKPDAGILHLGAAIEFKFATSVREVKVAIAGIVEDMNRYAGSKDWTRFYSVLYQTDAFISDDHLQAELGLNPSWRHFLATGSGSRKRR